MPTPTTYTFQQLLAEFPDDDACLDYLFDQLYGSLRHCPNCGVIAAEFYRVQGRKCYACIECRYQIHPTSGTIFHKSSTPLRLWFIAVYLISVSRNGIAATELERVLGVNYKTAWRMAHLIRGTMDQGNTLLKGILEADEVWIGGRRRSSNRFRNKTPVLGVVERKGKIRMLALDDVATARDVTEFLANNALVGSTLNTDESHLYHRASKVYKRQMVAHGRWQFVDGDIYTNSIEGAWTILKGEIGATHRSVTKDYLQLYINEMVWKYNHRNEVLFPLLIDKVIRARRRPKSKYPNSV